MENAQELSTHLLVYRGHVNTGVLVDGERVLLVDPGDASVLDHLPAGMRVEIALFTHHHRDVA